MRTVELLPDAELDDAVRGLWRRLAEAGLPGLADHPHPTNRPHLTLAEAAGFDTATVGAVLRAALPLPVTSSGLGLWTGRRGVTLHLAVVPSRALLDLHRAVSEAVDEPAEHLLPGQWSPHVSLALRLPPDRLGAAVEALGDTGLTGQWVGARSYTAGERTVETLV